MATKHNLLTTGFSFEAMLALPPQESRKYYLLNFFTPVAYEMLGSLPSGQNITGYAVLLIHRQKIDGSQFYRPVFHNAEDDGGAPYFQDFNCSPINKEQVVGDNTYVRIFDKITTGILDVEKQSEAIAHAFAECFSADFVGDTLYQNTCPVVASMSDSYDVTTGKEKITLNVVMKIASQLPRKHLCLSRICTRIETITDMPKYNLRQFNILTGEWVGLCEPGENCEECGLIYKSPAADNAYNDPEVFPDA